MVQLSRNINYFLEIYQIPVEALPKPFKTKSTVMGEIAFTHSEDPLGKSKISLLGSVVKREKGFSLYYKKTISRSNIKSTEGNETT